MEHLHVDGDVVVVLELVVDVVHRRHAHVAWRCLALHDDVDHERDGGRHGDVDVDDLRLHLSLRSEDDRLARRRLEDDEGEEDL